MFLYAAPERLFCFKQDWKVVIFTKLIILHRTLLVLILAERWSKQIEKTSERVCLGKTF